MKIIISCLLTLVMLFTAAMVFAEEAEQGYPANSDIVSRFVNETDLNTQAIALQIQSGDNVADLVFQSEGDNLHVITRSNGAEDGHLQMNAEAVYVESDGAVTMLRFDTVAAFIQQIIDTVEAELNKRIESIPEDQLPTEQEIAEVVDELKILAEAVDAQERADAATLNSAVISFANKFKPEYVLDIKEEGGNAVISLRSEAMAAAYADAMDELMSNPALAELVDREAAVNGGATFAQLQQEWKQNREATLKAIRSIQSVDAMNENGHWVSHFQIGEENSAIKILTSDMDAWIDAEDSSAIVTLTMGFKNEEPLMVYELAVDQYAYREKLTARDSWTEVRMKFENERIASGEVQTVIEGKEELRAAFGPDYMYMKGPKGGMSTTVRETWTGKTRYELTSETAEGKESTAIFDFYQEEDSLVCDMRGSESEESATIRICRLNKLNPADLSVAENVNEITQEKIVEELTKLVQDFIPTTETAEAGK